MSSLLSFSKSVWFVSLIGLIVGFFGVLLIDQQFDQGPRFNPPRSAVAFDGSKVVEKEFFETPSFTFDIVLSSATDKPPRVPKDRWPPVVFNSGHIGINQRDGAYRIWSRQTRTLWVGGKSTETTRLTISADAAKKLVRVFHNGVKVAEGPWNNTAKWIRIGKGSGNRYWSGDVEHFRLYNSAIYWDDFDPADRSHFDGTQIVSSLDDLR